jgi:hypothetical protein
MDPAFGHLVIKMFGRPPFGAQVILDGHEYVAVAAQGEGIEFVKEGNCFTEIADPQRLVRVADAWPRDAAIGRPGQVCDRWIYSACLCFGLDLEEQERSGFRYGYSVYQAEYSRNLLFKSGAQMEVLFDRILNQPRIRAALTIAPAPGGFTVAEHASRVRQLTGQDGYTTRQAAHDLRKLHGEQFISKPGRTRRYHVPPNSARVIAAALTLRDHVIAPILAGVRSPRMDRKPSIWTAVDRDYENLRVSMQTRFRHVGFDTITATA